MATRLEIAEKKLIRLNEELDLTTERAFSNMRLTNGQPMNDKRNGTAWFKKRALIEEKGLRLTEEIKKQEERISMLKRQEYNKSNNLTSNGGLQTSVKNIEALKKRIKEQEDDIKNGYTHQYSKAYLRKNKKKLEELERIQEQSDNSKAIMSDKVKELIKNGAVRQWQKKPIYYFVSELKKVALEIDENGNFKIADRYPAQSNDDVEYIKNLLK